MPIILSKREIKNLERLKLLSGTSNNDGRPLIYPSTNGQLLVKTFPRSTIPSSCKFETVDRLMALKNKDIMPEFIYPTDYVIVDGKMVGFAMPYYPSRTLRNVLNDPNISAAIKISYLKQVGDILKRMQAMRKNVKNGDFFINDLHEDNFIVDRNGILRVCDLDTCKIAGNETFKSKYLVKDTPIEEFPNKYRPIQSPVGGEFAPDENSDLYCYVMMIINILYNGGFYSIYSRKQYYDFLMYLSEIGVPLELIEMFAKVYSNEDNVNPSDLIIALQGYIDNPKVKEFKKKYNS